MTDGPPTPVGRRLRRMLEGHEADRGEGLGFELPSRYRFLRELGRGGMGVVVAAHDTELDRAVAIKARLWEWVGDDEGLERFLREGEALASARHPGVVGVHELLRAKGADLLIMELIEGESLAARIKRSGPVPPAETIELGLKLADALAHVHARGVIHRDLKPANVMLDHEGAPKIVDFGLTRRVTDTTSLSATGAILGTPGFLAPEQVRSGEIDARTDVYGLGATLYAALTGRAPCAARPGLHPIAALRSVLADAPAPAVDLVAGVPPALSAVCDRCLAKDPDARFPNADAVRDALESARAGETGPQVPWPLPALAGLTLAGILLSVLVVLSDAQPSRDASAAKPPPTAQPTDPEPAGDGLRTLVLQPGPLLGKDTHVRGDGLYVNDNYGCHEFMSVGHRRAGRGLTELVTYVTFDLSRLPHEAQLERATLALTVYDWDLQRAPLTVRALPVTDDWVEGTSTYDERMDGVVYRGDLQTGNPRTEGERPELSRPKPEQEPATEVEVQPEASVVTLDVSEHMRKRRDRTRLSLALVPVATPRPARWTGTAIRFSTSDAALPRRRPKLTLGYRGPLPVAVPSEAEQEREAAQRARERLSQAEDPRTRLVGIDEALRIAPSDLKLWLLRAEALAGLGIDESWTRAHRALLVGCSMHPPSTWPAEVFPLRLFSALRSEDPQRLLDGVRTLELCFEVRPDLYPDLRIQALGFLKTPPSQELSPALRRVLPQVIAEIEAMPRR